MQLCTRFIFGNVPYHNSKIKLHVSRVFKAFFFKRVVSSFLKVFIHIFAFSMHCSVEGIIYLFNLTGTMIVLYL